MISEHGPTKASAREGQWRMGVQRRPRDKSGGGCGKRLCPLADRVAVNHCASLRICPDAAASAATEDCAGGSLR